MACNRQTQLARICLPLIYTEGITSSISSAYLIFKYYGLFTAGRLRYISEPFPENSFKIYCNIFIQTDIRDFDQDGERWFGYPTL